MKRICLFLCAVGAFLIALILLWRLSPVDPHNAAFVAELFVVFAAAWGVSCFYVAYRLWRDSENLRAQITEAARQEAEAAVRDQIDALEAELSAAREYIRRVNHE